ncbi:hypothetical protein ABZV14_10150 [Streptosporangium canum]|uniref:hypothetical protein n=1 Tax=Streptosporangium canum TaxID=324952 RepID=UPI0033B419F3
MAAGVALVALAAPAQASAPAVPALPRPTGAHPIGATTLYPMLNERLGMPSGARADARAVDITRAYLLAFFDRHLRGRPEPLLRGPSPKYPEVRFWKTG